MEIDLKPFCEKVGGEYRNGVCNVEITSIEYTDNDELIINFGDRSRSIYAYDSYEETNIPLTVRIYSPEYWQRCGN